MPNMNTSTLSLRIKKLHMANVIAFQKKVKCHGQDHMLKSFVLSEGLVIMNTHAKYESPVS